MFVPKLSYKSLKDMRLPTLLVFLLATIGVARATASLTDDATDALREARLTNAQGDREKALAIFESRLLSKGATIAFDRSVTGHGKALGYAIDAWESSLDDSPFIVSNSTKRPDIVIKLVDELKTDEPVEIQGRVDASRKFFWNHSTHGYKLEATISICRRTEGDRLLTEREMGEVIAHELGHILGLDDNEDPKGLMGPFVPGVLRPWPSDEEIETVVRYRKELRDSIEKLTPPYTKSSST